MGRKLTNTLLLFLVCTLFLTIPLAYALEIFNDGFESGDFSAWTGTTATAPSEITITSTEQHHGTYSANSSIVATYDTAYCYQTITPENDTYFRMYFKTPTHVDSNTHMSILSAEHLVPYASLLRVYIKNVSGTIKWGIRWYDGGLQSADWSDLQLPSVSTWYSIEGRVKTETSGPNNDGLFRLWIDGNNLTDVAKDGCDTGVGGTENVKFGATGDNSDPGPYQFFTDCVIIADAYIGPETAGVDVSFGLPETVAFTSSLSALKEIGSILSETVAFQSALTHGYETGFLLSATIQFSEAVSRGIGKSFMLPETVHILESMTPEGLTQTVSFVLSETMKMLSEVSIPLTIIDEFFTALLFGSGAWLFLVVILAIALLVTTVVKYGSFPFIFVLMFLGVEYLLNVSQTSNFIYATIIAWGCIPLLIFIEAKRKR